MRNKLRQAVIDDFIRPEFRGEDPADYEIRDDGKPVRKDRWERAVHSIRYALGDNRREFEVCDIVKAVEALVNRYPDREI